MALDTHYSPKVTSQPYKLNFQTPRAVTCSEPPPNHHTSSSLHERGEEKNCYNLKFCGSFNPTGKWAIDGLIGRNGPVGLEPSHNSSNGTECAFEAKGSNNRCLLMERLTG